MKYPSLFHQTYSDCIHITSSSSLLWGNSEVVQLADVAMISKKKKTIAINDDILFCFSLFSFLQSCILYGVVCVHKHEKKYHHESQSNIRTYYLLNSIGSVWLIDSLTHSPSLTHPFLTYILTHLSNSMLCHPHYIIRTFVLYSAILEFDEAPPYPTPGAFQRETNYQRKKKGKKRETPETR